MKKVPWNNNQNIYLENVDLCVKNIVIGEFLTHGSFGLIYKVKYNNMDCVLKIVPIESKNKLEILPLKNTTKIRDFKREISILEKLDKKQLIPKLYLHGFCDIDYYYYKDEKKKKMKIGYIISEKYDITIRKYMEKLVDKFLDERNEKKLKEYQNELDMLDKKIKKDLEIACEELKIINDDTHIDNIMIKFDKKNNISQIKIVDWGSAKNGNLSKNDIFYRPFTKKFLMVIKNNLGINTQKVLGLDKL